MIYRFIMPHVWKDHLRYAGEEFELTPEEARALAGSVELVEAPPPAPVEHKPQAAEKPKRAEWPPKRKK